MYFGTLVTQTRNDQDQDNWMRDQESVSATTRTRFWRAVWIIIRRWSQK
jgi:hypothetical protein